MTFILVSCLGNFRDEVNVSRRGAEIDNATKGMPRTSRPMANRAVVAGSGVAVAAATVMLSLTAKSVAADEMTRLLKLLPLKAISPSGKVEAAQKL